MNLANLNNFIDAFAKFDIKSGEISIYTEAAARMEKLQATPNP